MYACLYVCVYMCVYACMCMYVRIDVCICELMDGCMDEWRGRVPRASYN